MDPTFVPAQLYGIRDVLTGRMHLTKAYVVRAGQAIEYRCYCGQRLPLDADQVPAYCVAEESNVCTTCRRKFMPAARSKRVAA